MQPVMGGAASVSKTNLFSESAFYVAVFPAGNWMNAGGVPGDSRWTGPWL